MRHDLCEFQGMTPASKTWRVIVLLAMIAVLAYDVFVGRL